MRAAAERVIVSRTGISHQDPARESVAATRIAAIDRTGLERLARYLLEQECYDPFMTMRSPFSSLAIVALAFGSMGSECGGGPAGPAFGKTTNAQCGYATSVMDGTTLMMQDTSVGDYTFAPTCQSSAVGPVLYYRATIPAGATLTGKTTGPSSLRILSYCGAMTCLASDADKGFDVGATAAYMNATSSRLDVILALGSSSNAGVAGAYDLTVSIK